MVAGGGSSGASASSAGGTVVAQTLLAEAGLHGLTAEHLVGELARVHGVLSCRPGDPVAETLWSAL